MGMDLNWLEPTQTPCVNVVCLSSPPDADVWPPSLKKPTAVEVTPAGCCRSSGDANWRSWAAALHCSGLWAPLCADVWLQLAVRPRLRALSACMTVQFADKRSRVSGERCNGLTGDVTDHDQGSKLECGQQAALHTGFRQQRFRRPVCQLNPYRLHTKVPSHLSSADLQFLQASRERPEGSSTSSAALQRRSPSQAARNRMVQVLGQQSARPACTHSPAAGSRLQPQALAPRATLGAAQPQQVAMSTFHVLHT